MCFKQQNVSKLIDWLVKSLQKQNIGYTQTLTDWLSGESVMTWMENFITFYANKKMYASKKTVYFKCGL